MMDLSNLNAFIIEILTFDYSYFWPHWEVSISDNTEPSSYESFDNWSYLNINLATATFVPYSESEIGSNYVKEFFDCKQPIKLSVILLQCAITDLLILSKEQQLAQVERLYKIELFWRYDFEMGVSEEGLLHEALGEPNEGVVNKLSTQSLFAFDYVFDGHNIIRANLPKYSSSIWLRKSFLSAYIDYVNEKISAIRKLIWATGISLTEEGLSQSKSTSSNKKIAVFIRNDARSSLIEEISSYVDEVDLKSLSDLINGKPIAIPIVVNCQQNVLGRIFYNAYRRGSIQATKAALSKWICQHFRRQLDGQVYELTYSTMLNHLKGVGFNQS